MASPRGFEPRFSIVLGVIGFALRHSRNHGRRDLVDACKRQGSNAA